MAESEIRKAAEKIKALRARSQRIKHFEWSASGEMIAAINPSGQLSIWDVATGHVMRDVCLLDTTLRCLAWSPDSRRVAVGSDAGTIIYDVEDLRKTLLSDHSGPVTAIAWSAKGDLLATGATDKMICIRDGVTGTRKSLSIGHEDSVVALSWNHCGDLLASASPDGTVRFWTRSGDPSSYWRMTGRSGISDVDWSPDDSSIAIACEDGAVHIIDATMQPTAVLEGHTAAITGVSYSADGQLLLSRSQEGTIRIWGTETWKELLLLKNMSDSGNYPGARFHPGDLQFGCLTGSTGVLELWKIDLRSMLGVGATAPSIQYTNAKVVLLGDTGVGKSGLSLVLTGQPYSPTDSTHGRKIWRFHSEVVQVDRYRKEVRETLLWDLAGQPGYRLVHQLSLNEVAIALLVFDSRSETDPFGSVRYWDRAVRLEAARRANNTGILKFLIAARVDRGGVGVSEKRIQRLKEETGARAYFATSAKAGTSIIELRTAIQNSIDWNNLPKVTSTELFHTIKNFLIDQKQRGLTLLSFEELYGRFIAEEDVRETSATQTEFNACTRLVDARGLIRRLSFGDLVLLQPELLDAYASAMVNEAREEPDGLGFLTEEDAKDGKFAIPSDERIVDPKVERLLLIATLEELLRHEVAFKDTLGDDISVIVFPAQFTREWPDAPDPVGKAVVFSFEGPVANVYCTLVIRLARSGSFKLKEMWKNAAIYDGPGESVCGVYVENHDDGHADLTIFYRNMPDARTRVRFEEFVHTHLLRKTIPQSLSRRCVFLCAECETEVTFAQAKARRERGFNSIQCNVCGETVSLEEDKREGGINLAEIARMDQTADAIRDREVATETLDGKLAVRDFDVFLSYNTRDKVFVREIAQKLKSAGILPWLDEEQIRPGQSWHRVLEADLKRIRCAIVFVGENRVGPWQDKEIQAILQEFANRKRSLIPVILPYAEKERSRTGVNGKRPKLPLFLRNLQWVDFRDDESRPFQKLLWGITGNKGSPRFVGARTSQAKGSIS